MPRRFRIKARGRTVWVSVRPLPSDWGLSSQGEIDLEERADDKAMLYAAAHEMLHECLPDLDENAVDETGDAIGELIHRLGFRREE